jgi:hypothetical protein
LTGGVRIGVLRLRGWGDFVDRFALFLWCLNLIFGSQAHVKACRKSTG